MSHIKKQFSGGQAMLISVTFFMFISTGVVLGITGPVLSETRIAETVVSSKKAIEVTQAGIEDTTLLIKQRKVINGARTVSIDGNSSSIIVTVIDEDNKDIDASATIENVTRGIDAGVTKVIEASFLFGAQIGDGGLSLRNQATVSGEVHSNGPIIGQNQNEITGRVTSAGPNGRIEDVYIFGNDALASTITDSVVEGDAYYQTIDNTTVWGTLYPGSPDPAQNIMPIPDEVVADLERSATSTIISSPCPYEISTDTTIGPAKIECDVIISGSPTVTLAGNLWITGDLHFKNSPAIVVLSALDKKSIAIVVDNPADRLTSSKIDVDNTVTFSGSGHPSSFVLLLSQNESAEQGGVGKAMDITNSISGDYLLYAGHGEILIKNKVSLVEASAYKISAQNTASVIYTSALKLLQFPAGEGGIWRPADWGE